MIDAEKILIKAISTGNCAFTMLHIPKSEWNCRKFESCEDCAKALLKQYDKERKNEVN